MYLRLLVCQCNKNNGLVSIMWRYGTTTGKQEKTLRLEVKVGFMSAGEVFAVPVAKTKLAREAGSDKLFF